MKTIKILIAFSIITFNFNANALYGFVHPLEFRNTEIEREKVEAQIKNQVNEKYNKLGLGDVDEIMLREQEELIAFIQLMKIENRVALDASIKKACSPSTAISNCGNVQVLRIYEGFE